MVCGSKNSIEYRNKSNLPFFPIQSCAHLHRKTNVESLSYFFLQLWLCNDSFFIVQLAFICEEKAQMLFGLKSSLCFVSNTKKCIKFQHQFLCKGLLVPQNTNLLQNPLGLYSTFLSCYNRDKVEEMRVRKSETSRWYT